MALIFYKNLKKHRKITEKNLVFSIFDQGVTSNKDDQVCDARQCKSFHNLTYLDGALKTGLGFKDFEVPASLDKPNERHKIDFSKKVDKVCGIWTNRWFYEDENAFSYNLYAIDTQNRLWGVVLIDELDGMLFQQYTLPSYPTLQCSYRINNKDASLFFTTGGMVAFLTDVNGIYKNVPPMISCAVHYDSFFGITNTNRNTLVYTKNKDLLKWDDSANSTIEFLDNIGSFNKVVAFNDYVYLFRDFGITKLSIYTTKDDFSFTHLYNCPSKIFENTVCVCGDRIFFMTRDGLYAFNGNSVRKICQEYDVYLKELDNEHATCACLNGKFYLASRCNFDDGLKVGCESGDYVNNVLFEIDIDTLALNLCRGVDVLKLLPIDTPFMNELCACFNTVYTQKVGFLTNSGSVFGSATQKSWTSFETDLGVKSKRKRIKEIVLTTHFPCKVRISSDEEEKVFDFDGKEDEQRLSVSVYGKNFQFEFFTDRQECFIQKPLILFDVMS